MAKAQVTDIELSVKGLACPFCVHGIRKKVGEVEGVTSVEVSLKDGIVRVVPSGSSPPEPSALKEAVTKAGFTAGELRLNATGTLAVASNGVRLQVRGSDAAYILFEQGVEFPRFCRQPEAWL